MAALRTGEKMIARKPRWSFHLRASNARYLFVLPAAIYLITFFAYPLGYNVVISFQNVDLAHFIQGSGPFIGLDNYRTVLNSSVFHKAASNMVEFTALSLIFQFTIGMLLALFFNRSFPLSRTLRALMLVPWLLPLIVVATAFKWLFADPNGLIDYVFGTILHLVPPHEAWLSDPHVALAAAIVVNIWVGVPFNTVILHSGLQSIPPEIYEAAGIDGAGPWTRFWRITLPLLRPVISILLVLGLIYTLKVFGLMLVLTGGGPADATQLFSLVSYQLSFGDFQFGQGAAAGNIMVLVALVGAICYLFVLRSEQGSAV
jgi:multiple sugar transport system permease protein